MNPLAVFPNAAAAPALSGYARVTAGNRVVIGYCTEVFVAGAGFIEIALASEHGDITGTRLLAVATVTEIEPLTEERALELVRDRRVSLAELADAVAVEFGISRAAMGSGSRMAHLCSARFAFFGLAGELTDASLDAMAVEIGRHCHGTARHGVTTFRDRLEGDRVFRAHIARLRAQFNFTGPKTQGPTPEP